MNIIQIKAAICEPVLNIAFQMDKTTGKRQLVHKVTFDPATAQDIQDGNAIENPWLYHWNNEKRVRVTMHEDVYNLIKQGTNRLAFKVKQVAAKATGEVYTHYTLITPTAIVDSL